MDGILNKIINLDNQAKNKIIQINKKKKILKHILARLSKKKKKKQIVDFYIKER